MLLRLAFLGFCAVAVALVQPTRGPRTALFDGRTLEGWEGNTAVWRVRDGAIVGGSLDGNPRNEFLATTMRYRHFSLRFEYKLVGTEGFVNGGVQFRSHRISDPPNEMIGYQADIGAGHSGKLYDESRRKRFLAEPEPGVVAALEKPGDWNRMEVIAEGPRVRLRLNGRIVVDYVEREPGIDDSGHIALQIHGNCKAEIAFRNLTIEEFPDSIIPAQQEILNRFGRANAPALALEPFAGGKFALADNEIIVLAGQENLVRDQAEGALEARLVSGFAERRPRFRSMAWEGDTVYEQWRDANLGSWTAQLAAAEATIAFLQFGQMESFDGRARLAEFTPAYHRLLEQFAARTPRLVLISPIPFENAASATAPLAPDLRSRNADVRAYADAIREIARQRGAVFVDLFTPPASRPADAPRLTDNGVHLNATGLHVVADLIAQQLGAPVAASAATTELRTAIADKNRLWFDCWRPANWSFVYGNRVMQMFGKPAAEAPSLHTTFERHKPMIAALDARIHALARGEKIIPPVFDFSSHFSPASLFRNSTRAPRPTGPISFSSTAPISATPTSSPSAALARLPRSIAWRARVASSPTTMQRPSVPLRDPLPILSLNGNARPDLTAARRSYR